MRRDDAVHARGRSIDWTDAMTHHAPVTHPKGWGRAELARDRNWIFRTCGRGMFEKDRADFPIGAAARRMLDEAIVETQTGFGFQLLRGAQIAGLSDDDARLLFRVEEAFEARLAHSHEMGMRIYADRRAYEAGQAA
jgi:hypothetical protein